MSAEVLSILALACFAIGAAAALLAFRVEALRSSWLQLGAAGLGMVFKTAAIGMACADSQTHFFNSPSEMIGLLAWSLGFSYLIALTVSAARSLGAVIMPLVVVLSIISLFISRETVGIAVPMQRLFAVHVLSAFLGYGLFLTACGASVLYLEQARLLKRKMFGAIFRDLPSLERLERLEMICSWLGLAIFSVAMITGAIMASESGKPFWLEPKFMSAQVTWLVFLVLVIGRAARRLSGRTAAKCVLAGAALVLLTLALGHPFGRPQTAAGRGDTETRGRGDLHWGTLTVPSPRVSASPRPRVHDRHDGSVS
ncbi:MAG TPA: cytochrome c biogenesis protein CcsA [Planctomycetota bacterium]|nr:cytochrome c biogenesis protein CcsA [Planctomycetota bacterium]